MSTVAGHAGGPVRSSDEGPVIGLERRGRVVRGCVRSSNWAAPRRSRVDRQKSSGKPFDISKVEVWSLRRASLLSSVKIENVAFWPRPSGAKVKRQSTVLLGRLSRSVSPVQPAQIRSGRSRSGLSGESRLRASSAFHCGRAARSSQSYPGCLAAPYLWSSGARYLCVLWCPRCPSCLFDRHALFSLRQE